MRVSGADPGGGGQGALAPPPPHKKLLPQIVRHGSRGGQEGLAPPPLQNPGSAYACSRGHVRPLQISKTLGAGAGGGGGLWGVDLLRGESAWLNITYFSFIKQVFTYQEATCAPQTTNNNKSNVLKGRDIEVQTNRPYNRPTCIIGRWVCHYSHRVNLVGGESRNFT